MAMFAPMENLTDEYSPSNKSFIFYFIIWKWIIKKNLFFTDRY